MKSMKNLKVFLADESGAETVEWIVIAAVVLATGTLAYRTNLGSIFTTAFAKITAALS